MDVEGHLVGPFVVTRELLLRYMLPRQDGVVVFLGTHNGQHSRGVLGQLGFDCAKTALSGLLAVLTAQCGRHVRFHLVRPGITVTESPNWQRRRLLDPGWEDRESCYTPAGELPRPADVARAIAWLASNEARMINGVELAVDGGLSASSRLGRRQFPRVFRPLRCPVSGTGSGRQKSGLRRRTHSPRTLWARQREVRRRPGRPGRPAPAIYQSPAAGCPKSRPRAYGDIERSAPPQLRLPHHSVMLGAAKASNLYTSPDSGTGARMLVDFLPLGTIHDPTEDPPGSVDPLGTAAGAEQLAEVLFPGFTARMWRARFLTLAVVTSRVADDAVGLLKNREELRLPARLAFERLLVSALARREAELSGTSTAHDFKRATRRLPGVGLARLALSNGDLPLSAGNFLKGQAVNGPFGVIARLAPKLGVVDDETDQLTPIGHELFDAWQANADTFSVVTIARKVADVVHDRVWPNRNWVGWQQLADCLSPHRIPARERNKLYQLLMCDPTGVRPRMLELLQTSSAGRAWRTVDGGPERNVMLSIARHESSITN